MNYEPISTYSRITGIIQMFYLYDVALIPSGEVFEFSPIQEEAPDFDLEAYIANFAGVDLDPALERAGIESWIAADSD